MLYPSCGDRWLWALVAACAFIVAEQPLVFARSAGAPGVTSDSPFTVAEGRPAVATFTATVSDTKAADRTRSSLPGRRSDKFTLSTAGVLALNSPLAVTATEVAAGMISLSATRPKSGLILLGAFRSQPQPASLG